jgi:signal transduction histidine kinase
MSQRIVRQLDLIIAYGRWLALLGILLVTFVSLPLHPDSPAWTILIITAIVAILDAAPVVMLHLKFYPDYAALAVSAVDTAFSLVMLYLGGGAMLFYCFVPVLAMSTRYDWVIGLADAGFLAIGHILVSLARVQFRSVGQVLPAAVAQALSLLLVSLLGGFLTDNLKKEPPLEDQEARKLNEELRKLQAAADRSRAIYEMASMLGATLDPDKILDAVLEISAVGFDELVGAGDQFRERPASAVFLFGAEGMYIATSRNISHKEASLWVSGDQGVLFQVLSKDQPMLLGNLANDPDLRQFTPFRRCRSAICVPLRAGFELYGAVLFASPRPGAFTEEHLELLTAVSNQAAVAMNTAQLYQDIQLEKEKILEVEEEERSKLARDLHDGPTQSISAIAMRLNFARLLLEREPQKVKEELFKLENLARRTTKEIRTMLFALRPVVLETQGLKVAVEQLVEKLQETGDLPVTLEIEDVEEQIDVNTKAVAWFTVQEALTNARKYAEAESIWVRIYVRNEHFVAEIEDDGVGFDYDAKMATYDQSGSFGLRNYKERADLVNGRSIVRAAPGKGTKVTLVVPLRQEVI